MIYRPIIAIVLLLSPLALGDSNSDAVNERIPVRKAELEAHWQVDCASALHELLVMAAPGTIDPNCSIPTELRRNIQLCAFIYQPPGGRTDHQCPDYSGIHEHLNRVSESSQCSNLNPAIIRMVDCGEKTL